MNAINFLSLTEIAAWQVSCFPANPGSVIAALPSLQRGAVWKVKQTEELWDSILRRFPVGAFVISRIGNGKLGMQPYRHQQNDLLYKPTHYLLDGQQRANGIALGLFDVWQPGVEAGKVKNVCWIDIGVPPSGRDVVFVFRLVTRAHPWGYSRTDPDKRLSENQIRLAIRAFQITNSPQYYESRPEDFPLTLTWPWDADAPLPLSILIASICKHRDDLEAAKRTAWMRIEKLPLFAKSSFTDWESQDIKDKYIVQSQEQLAQQLSNVRSAFFDPDSIYSVRLSTVFRQLAEIFRKDNPYGVPLLSLDLNMEPVEPKQDEISDAQLGIHSEQYKQIDPVELLFHRINSAGTPLAGEELVYSLLKSAWVDVPHFIEDLKNKPSLPSRIAMLCIRLVLARQQNADLRQDNDRKRYVFPPAPGVEEFRRLIRKFNPTGSNFFDMLQNFIKSDASVLFERAWNFLTDRTKCYTLPSVLAVEMAQKSPDVFFLLLRWTDRLCTLDVDISSLDDRHHRRTLGFLTSLAWFSRDKAKASASVWQALQNEDDVNRLKYFFNKRSFSQTCRLDEKYNLRMIPLLTVDELDIFLKKYVTGYQGCQNTITRDDSDIWKEGWDWFYSRINKIAEELKDSYVEKLDPKAPNTSEDELDLPEFTRSSCQIFFDTLWNSRSILLYAQRSWLAQWFPRFDPSLPEFIEDKNRPWDYDHIHPQGYLRSDSGNSLRNIPCIIKDWHNSIGNLRAWPLELNRSYGDTSPINKLTHAGNDEIRYSMYDSEQVRSASFIHDDWQWWEKSVLDGYDRHYLSSSKYHDARCALIRAIVVRLVALYREWYETLRINELH